MEIIKQTFKERLEDSCKLRTDSSLFLNAKRNQQRRLIREQQLIQLLMNLRYDQFFCGQVEEILPILLPGMTFPKVDKSPTQKAIYFFHQFFQQAGLKARLNELIEMLENKTSSKASIFSRLIVVLIQNSRWQFKQSLTAAIQLKQVKNGYISQQQISNKQPRAFFKMDQMARKNNQKLKLNTFVKPKRQTQTVQVKKREILLEKRNTIIVDKKQTQIASSCFSLKKSIQVRPRLSNFFQAPTVQPTKDYRITFRQAVSKFKGTFISFLQILDLEDCDFLHFKSIRKSTPEGSRVWLKQSMERILRQRLNGQPFMQSKGMLTQKNLLGSDQKLKIYRYQNRIYRRAGPQGQTINAKEQSQTNICNQTIQFDI